MRRVLSYTLLSTLALGLVGVTGCAPGEFSELVEREQQRYLRCMHEIGPAYCKGDYDFVADSKAVCGKRMADRYAQQESEALRKAWLKSHGCPADRVEP